MKKVKINGRIFIIKKSTRKNKQLMAVPEFSGHPIIHFGDPTMPEYPSTKRGDMYCARSFGIGNLNNTKSANFWSRTYLWKCKDKKSI